MADERDLEERVALAPGIVQAPQEGARAAVVLDRLVVGVHGPRRVAGEQRVARRALGLVGLGEVVRQRPVDGVARIAVERLDGLADAPVQGAPGGLQQAVVGHFLHQAVAEAILRRGTPADLDDQVEPHQVRERRHDLVVRQQALEQRQPEAAADRARDGDDLARARRQAVEPRLQCALHERRHGDLTVGELPHAVAAAQRAALDQILERFLEEERVPARALGQQIGERSRQRALGQRLGQLAARARRQRPQLDLVVAVREDRPRVLAQPPRRLVALGPVDQHDAQLHLVGQRQQVLDELDRQRVRPLQIVDDDAERAAPRPGGGRPRSRPRTSAAARPRG